MVSNLDLATARALTDLCLYMNSNLVLSKLKFWAFYSEIAIVEVVIPSGLKSGLEQKLLLATSIGFNDLKPCDGGWSQNPV